jgi:hypothetical protein
MQTWEYLVLNLDVRSRDLMVTRANRVSLADGSKQPLHEALNFYGAQGWEVVGTLGAVKDCRDEAVLLKRPKV